MFCINFPIYCDSLVFLKTCMYFKIVGFFLGLYESEDILMMMMMMIGL
jgi:hypothetical protein